MFRRTSPALIGWTSAALALLVTLGGEPAPGQPVAQKPKELQWTHAFDLACRKYGEEKFTKETQKFGVEAFKDNNNGLGLYVCQTGSIALAHGFATLRAPLPKAAGPKWLTGLDLPGARPARRCSPRTRRSTAWKCSSTPTPITGSTSPRRATSQAPVPAASRAAPTRRPSGYTASICPFAREASRSGPAPPSSASRFTGTATPATSSTSVKQARSPSHRRPLRSRAMPRPPLGCTGWTSPAAGTMRRRSRTARANSASRCSTTRSRATTC